MNLTTEGLQRLSYICKICKVLRLAGRFSGALGFASSASDADQNIVYNAGTHIAMFAPVFMGLEHRRWSTRIDLRDALYVNPPVISKFVSNPLRQEVVCSFLMEVVYEEPLRSRYCKLLMSIANSRTLFMMSLTWH
jgi:hypothetical protein